MNGTAKTRTWLDMDAVILCEGMGTRIREGNEIRPKPMLDVGGKPSLWQVMKIYAAFGVRNFILCLVGYKGDVIRGYFLNYRYTSRNFTADLSDGTVEVEGGEQTEDWRVTLLDAGPLTNTGGRMIQACKKVRNKAFFATYGDGVASIDLEALYTRHKRANSAATVTNGHPSARFGKLKIKDGSLNRFSEKPHTTTGSINGGIFVFEKDVFKNIPNNPGLSLESQARHELAESGDLSAYEHDGLWHCMDTYREMLDLNEIWAQGNAPWVMDHKYGRQNQFPGEWGATKNEARNG